MHNYPLPLSFDVSNFRSTFQNFTRLNTRGSDQLLLLTSPPPPPPPRILIFSKPFFPFLYIRHTPLAGVSSYLRRETLIVPILSSRNTRRIEKKKGKRKKEKKSEQGKSGKKMRNFSRLEVLRAPLCRGNLK